MTQRNNPRSKVVFLADLVLSMISQAELISDKNQTNRPSSLNQNQEQAPYFDRIEAQLRSNEENEENQLQPIAASIPTHTPLRINIKIPFPTSNEYPEAAIFSRFCSDSSKLPVPDALPGKGINRSAKGLLAMSHFEALGSSFF